MKRVLKILLVFSMLIFPLSVSHAYESHSGWWYIKGKPGTGISVEIQGRKCFAAMFEYERGEPFWLSAYGDIIVVDSNTTTDVAKIVFGGTLNMWNGWPLGSQYSKPTKHDIGTMLIEFSSDTEAKLVYIASKDYLDTDTDVVVKAEIIKFMPEIAPGAPDPRGISGWWYDPSYDGMGMFLEAYGNKVFMAWYYYGYLGQPWWTSCSADFTPFDNQFTCTLQEWTGGSPMGVEPYVAPIPTDQAPITFRLTGEGRADMVWEGNTFHLQRFIFGF
ncbi:MAG: hypothetical protein GXO58_04690 [Thermodesulfobacteria bacterium]|nr:hypothetical protein [Thermodesulfobacteriota bacterium]